MITIPASASLSVRFETIRLSFAPGSASSPDTPLGSWPTHSIGIPLGAPYTYSNNNGGTPLFQFPPTSPTNQALQYGGTGFYDAYNPNFKDPQTAQWNVTIERELEPTPHCGSAIPG